MRYTAWGVGAALVLLNCGNVAACNIRDFFASDRFESSTQSSLAILVDFSEETFKSLKKDVSGNAIVPINGVPTNLGGTYAKASAEARKIVQSFGLSSQNSETVNWAQHRLQASAAAAYALCLQSSRPAEQRIWANDLKPATVTYRFTFFTGRGDPTERRFKIATRSGSNETERRAKKVVGDLDEELVIERPEPSAQPVIVIFDGPNGQREVPVPPKTYVKQTTWAPGEKCEPGNVGTARDRTLTLRNCVALPPGARNVKPYLGKVVSHNAGSGPSYVHLDVPNKPGQKFEVSGSQACTTFHAQHSIEGHNTATDFEMCASFEVPHTTEALW